MLEYHPVSDGSDAGIIRAIAHADVDRAAVADDLHLVHPHGDLIRPELLAVQLHVQQPVVLFGLIGQRAIDQVAAGGVIHRQQLLGIEVVGTGQLQNLRAGDGQGIDLILELSVLVISHDDPALIEFRQGCRELAVQVLNDLVSVHVGTSQCSS